MLDKGEVIMKVVIKKADKMPEVKEIPNELSAFHEIVGGYIETFPFDGSILCICNEEGKLQNLKPNFVFHNGISYDVICGDVFFVNADGENFAGLTDEQVNVINAMFN